MICGDVYTNLSNSHLRASFLSQLSQPLGGTEPSSSGKLVSLPVRPTFEPFLPLIRCPVLTARVLSKEFLGGLAGEDGYPEVNASRLKHTRSTPLEPPG